MSAVAPDDLEEGTLAEGSLAEALGLTDELAGAMAGVAEAELVAGRPEPARAILEGLVVANPRAPEAWTLLARAHRALRQPLAARFCAEVAGSLDPEAPATLLARAEGLLPFGEEREQALALLRRAAAGEGEAPERARALLAAAGPAGSDGG